MVFKPVKKEKKEEVKKVEETLEDSENFGELTEAKEIETYDPEESTNEFEQQEEASHPQLSQQEVADMIEGHLQRANNLLQLFKQ